MANKELKEFLKESKKELDENTKEFFKTAKAMEEGL